ncbi:MAG: hypothetical protein HON53_24220 [Planctomycetaceae bacterium]|jgi:hypothetical protein|nr:hypothetical protein [Planctomycetaceae bacterium]MBT6153060.1 hypothetical protein [Planctomycetaceae bacterium]MBT6487953.1 hypothetical protein [Planctomycetaceae bacterium]MBT6495050.1 hypothetical protein [Planctomycetaceae bacterium]
MTRFILVFAALGVWTIAGCGPADNNADATDSSETSTETNVEQDMKDAGMEGMSAEEYNKGGTGTE